MSFCNVVKEELADPDEDRESAALAWALGACFRALGFDGARKHVDRLFEVAKPHVQRPKQRSH